MQLPGDSEGRDRWRVVGVGRPGGVPVGATLDSMSTSVTKSPSGLNLSGISTHVFWTLGLKINTTNKAQSVIQPWPFNRSCLLACPAASRPQPAAG